MLSSKTNEREKQKPINLLNTEYFSNEYHNKCSNEDAIKLSESILPLFEREFSNENLIMIQLTIRKAKKKRETGF